MLVDANFEKNFILPGFLLNFRKVAKFQNFNSKVLRVIDKNLWGSLLGDLATFLLLKKGECNLNQSKDDSFVERVAKNNS